MAPQSAMKSCRPKVGTPCSRLVSRTRSILLMTSESGRIMIPSAVSRCTFASTACSSARLVTVQSRMSIFNRSAAAPPHLGHRAHPQIDNKAAARLSSIVRPVLHVFELLELIQQPLHVERHGLTPGLRGSQPRGPVPTPPVRQVAGSQGQDADL